MDLEGQVKPVVGWGEESMETKSVEENSLAPNLRMEVLKWDIQNQLLWMWQVAMEDSLFIVYQILKQNLISWMKEITTYQEA